MYVYIRIQQICIYKYTYISYMNIKYMLFNLAIIQNICSSIIQISCRGIDIDKISIKENEKYYILLFIYLLIIYFWNEIIEYIKIYKDIYTHILTLQITIKIL